MFGTVAPPRVNFRELPEAERETANQISNHLLDLARYTERFEAALRLFESCDAEIADAHAQNAEAMSRAQKAGPVFGLRLEAAAKLREQTRWPSQWQFMAADDGAMSIYHFGISFRSIAKAITSCPELHKRVGDLDEKTMLLSVIPDFWSVRNAVAHKAENLRDAKKHSISGPYDDGFVKVEDGARNIFFGGNLAGSTYTFTVKGQPVSYDISRSTLDKLAGIRDEVFARFKKAKMCA